MANDDGNVCFDTRRIFFAAQMRIIIDRIRQYRQNKARLLNVRIGSVGIPLVICATLKPPQLKRGGMAYA
jgi:hypothetical protein